MEEGKGEEGEGEEEEEKGGRKGNSKGRRMNEVRGGRTEGWGKGLRMAGKRDEVCRKRRK